MNEGEGEKEGWGERRRGGEGERGGEEERGERYRSELWFLFLNLFNLFEHF